MNNHGSVRDGGTSVAIWTTEGAAYRVTNLWRGCWQEYWGAVWIEAFMRCWLGQLRLLGGLHEGHRSASAYLA